MATLTTPLELLAPTAQPFRPEIIEFRIRAVSWSSIDHLSARLGIASPELVELIGMAERTALRRQKEGFLKPDESDRLLRVERVFNEAIRVFGKEDKAAQWLKTPSVMFGKVAPLSLLGCDAGAQAVGEELIRIDFGDFA